MANPYLAEIRMFAGNFAPVGWAFCDGSLLPIAEYDALFNLLGTTFGGDGQETFGLPNLAARIPLHAGQGPGLTNRVQGEAAGQRDVTLSVQNLPVHTHPMIASTSPATLPNPQDAVIADGAPLAFLRDSPSTSLPGSAVTPVGGSQPHDNTMPTIFINYIISLYGV